MPTLLASCDRVSMFRGLTSLDASRTLFAKNCCHVLPTLGAALHTAFPHINVIGFNTLVEDKAARCFTTGFYGHIGKAIEDGTKVQRGFESLPHPCYFEWALLSLVLQTFLEQSPSIREAYDAAVKRWEDEGKVFGDPKTKDGAPSGAHGVYGILEAT